MRQPISMVTGPTPGPIRWAILLPPVPQVARKRAVRGPCRCQILRVWGWRMHAAFQDEIDGGGDKELTELDKIVPRGGVALDIGANRGVYSYKLGEICSRVIAFEPNPDIAETLRRLKRPNVEVCELALSDEGGTAELTIPASEHLHGFGYQSRRAVDHWS